MNSNSAESINTPENGFQSREPWQAQHENPKNSFWVVFISLLLVVLVGLNITQFIMTYRQNQIAAERAASYQIRVKAAQDLLERQKSVVFGLITNYQKDAYDNPQLDRIAEQQLVATEYTLTALQIIAIQNTQIIELLSSTP
jgi:hypothetical protein